MLILCILYNIYKYNLVIIIREFVWDNCFLVVFNEVNEHLKAHVPSNSVYQHKTTMNDWAGVQWDIDADVGT